MAKTKKHALLRLVSLYTDQNRLFRNARQRFDFDERLLNIPLECFVSHDDKRYRAAFLPSALDHLRDADAVSPKNSGNLRQHSRLVERHESKVIEAANRIHR